MENENYFTLKEVSQKLKLSRLTVFRWIHDGKIKATKIGSQWRIKESEINSLFEKQDNKEEIENVTSEV